MSESNLVDDYRSNLYAKMAEYQIPDYMQTGLAAYIMDGSPVGHFLTAVLENNLAAAVHRGDEINQERLHLYIKFLHNHAPNGCWGREGVMQYWRERGGMRAAILAMK